MHVQKVEPSRKTLFGAAVSRDSSCDGFHGQYEWFDTQDIVPQPSAEDLVYVFEKHRRMKKDIRRRKTRRRPIRLQKHSRCSHDVEWSDGDRHRRHSDPPERESTQQPREEGSTQFGKGPKLSPIKMEISLHRKKMDQQREAEKETLGRDDEEEAGNDDDDDLIGREVYTSQKTSSKDVIAPAMTFPSDPREAISKSLELHRRRTMVRPKKKQLGGRFVDVNNLEDELNYEFISRVQKSNRKLQNVLDLEQLQQEEEEERDDDSSNSYDNLQTAARQNKTTEQWLPRLGFSLFAKDNESDGNFLSHVDTFSDTDSIPDVMCWCL